jgi:aspartate 4-decarboxylase
MLAGRRGGQGAGGVSGQVTGRIMNGINLHDYERLSPFELKDALIGLAAHRVGAGLLLNAGRGNPNWVATHARAAFFHLGQFALTESRRVIDDPSGLGGLPGKDGIAARLDAWRDAHAPDADLTGITKLAADISGLDPDSLVHAIAMAILGCDYPSPVRMLDWVERIIRRYLAGVLGLPNPPDAFDLFATEGGTAAITDLFRCLKANRLLRPGDRIALGTPIFSPYLEIPPLEDYGLEPVHVHARRENGYQYSSMELEKLVDPRVKALLLVNPGNPTSFAIGEASRDAIVSLVRARRPDLIVVTDDVYAPFVDGFHSLLGLLPENTIGIWSFSKYFGATGWRLGVIATHRDTILDRAIAALPEQDRAALDRRYGALALDPGRMRFVDRMVADSRDVALNHTAGLSTPQQAMMALFALADMADKARLYRTACVGLLKRRVAALADGLGVTASPGPLFDNYYGLIDLDAWLRAHLGEDAARHIRAHVHPLDIVFRLARDHGIVLLNGGGFDAPDWSVRVSFANLDDAVYRDIGAALRAVTEEYVQAFKDSDPA